MDSNRRPSLTFRLILAISCAQAVLLLASALVSVSIARTGEGNDKLNTALVDLTENVVEKSDGSLDYQDKNFVDRVRERNPNAWFYQSNGHESIAFGQPPRRIDAIVNMEAEGCETRGFSFVDEVSGLAGRGTVSRCNGTLYAVELGGIEDYFDPLTNPKNWGRILSVSGRANFVAIWLVTSLVLAIVTAVIVSWTIRPMRRAAKLADRLTGDPRMELLSEDETFAEVQPYVAAVNAALQGLRMAYKQQERFSASAAHEMRTPLTILRARLDELPESEIKKSLIRDTRRMIDTVQQLLQLAEPQGSKRKFEELDLTDFVRRLTAELTPKALEADKDLEFEGEESLTVSINRRSVRSAVSNLINNAIKHTGAASEITVRVSKPANVEVIDHGPGIDEKSDENFLSRSRNCEKTVPVRGLVWPS